MSNCCSNHASKIVGEICPKCRASCKSVENKTLYHQVKFPENQAVFQEKYYFCPAKKCPVGYFSSTGQIIPKRSLRTYQEIEDDKLCYCFDINTKQYLGKRTGWCFKLLNLFHARSLSELKVNNADAIKNFVIQKTKSEDCACDVKNPSGQCCLAKFKALASARGASI